MMEDVECPYCDSWNEINHDDGFGYDEGVLHQMTCCDCNKQFLFNTTISHNYDARKADCLNGELHKYELSCTYPKELSKMSCVYCDDRRDMTDVERAEYKIDTVVNYIKNLSNEG